MTPRFTIEQLANAFSDLLELAQTARQQWFASKDLHPDDRLQLQRMLLADADAEPGFLDESVELHAQALSSQNDHNIEPGDLLGQQFGSFRLTGLLGQGGMATVFSAEKVGVDFEQIVAVKLLKRGLFSSIEQKLFRRERRLLAQLNHPNIAHMIDGGVTEAGISYLVMEYVDGVRLDQYVLKHQLDLRARLELFIVVCGAVESAHQSLIVHRDIKPSNILITRDGVPKLLDFGIAKLLLEDNDGDSPNHTLTAALTPGYAAPEQMAGSPVTTATDVYALGVVLHELLTGKHPISPDSLASSTIDVAATVKPHQLPMPAVMLKRALRGDLDNIIAHALSAEPNHRYPTAAALIDDLQRYLDGRPVNAHPRSRWYVVRKFTRRHYAAVLTGTLVSIALLGLLGTASWQAEQARIEAQRANLVRDFLLDLLDTAKANLPPDQQPTPAALAKKAAERLESNTELPDLTRADLLHTLGQVSLSAGGYDQAATMLNRAVAIRTAELGPEHTDTLSTFLQLGDTYTRQGKYTEARKLLQRVLPILRKKDTTELIEALTLCVFLEAEAGDIEAAFTCQTEESQAVNRLLVPDSIEALLSKLRFGDLLGAVQRSREAIDVLEPALSAWRTSGNSTEHADYLISLNNLAVAYYSLGELDKAIPIFEQVLVERRKVVPPGHPDIANSLANLGAVLMGSMRYDEAEIMLEEALQISRASLGDAHPEVVIRLIQLSTNDRRRNHMEAAIQYARDAVAMCTNSEIVSSSACLHAQLSMSEALRSIDAKESLQYADLALQQFQTQYKAPNSNIAIAMHARAASLFNSQRLRESLDQSDASISMFSALSAGESSDALVAKQTRALTLSSLGRHKEASAVIDMALQSWREHFPVRKDRLLLMLETRVKIQLAIGNTDAAKASAREALSLKIDESILTPATVALFKKTAQI